MRVPAHWVTVRRHHRLVRVHRRAHTKVVKVTRCHPRIVKRRITVWVTVHRHGKKVRVKRRKVVRVAVPPTLVAHTTRRVRHGRGTTVSGWLGTTGQRRARRTDDPSPDGTRQRSGTVLAGRGGDDRRVRRLDGAAPGGPVAAGRGRLRRRPHHGILDLGPGASDRSCQGQDQDQPEDRAVGIEDPHHRPGARRIRPVNSNLLRLNVGIGRIGHLEGLPEIQPDGRFLIVWKFDPGHGVLHPWFSVGTLSESAFPWAPRRASAPSSRSASAHPSPSITTANTATESGTGDDDRPASRRYAQPQPLAACRAAAAAAYSSRTGVARRRSRRPAGARIWRPLDRADRAG